MASIGSRSGRRGVDLTGLIYFARSGVSAEKVANRHPSFWCIWMLQKILMSTV